MCWLSIYTLLPRLFNARPLFWNYQPFYIPPPFILRSERCHFQHPTFLRESQIALIQCFSCWPQFATASTGRRVLNVRNLSMIQSSAWMVTKHFCYVCYLIVVGFKEMGLKIISQCWQSLTDMVGPGLWLGSWSIFGESSYWFNVACFHYMQGYIILSLRAQNDVFSLGKSSYSCKNFWKHQISHQETLL